MYNLVFLIRIISYKKTIFLEIQHLNIICKVAKESMSIFIVRIKVESVMLMETVIFYFLEYTWIN